MYFSDGFSLHNHADTPCSWSEHHRNCVSAAGLQFSPLAISPLKTASENCVKIGTSISKSLSILNRWPAEQRCVAGTRTSGRHIRVGGSHGARVFMRKGRLVDISRRCSVTVERGRPVFVKFIEFFATSNGPYSNHKAYYRRISANWFR